MEPAATIIRLFGGAQAVATIVGKHFSQVYRWTYPETRGGCGGMVPARYQRALLNHAQTHEIDLRPGDFFSPDRLTELLKEPEGAQP